MVKFVMINQHHYDDALANAARMAEEDFAKAKGEN
jgi:hypothetical protein